MVNRQAQSYIPRLLFLLKIKKYRKKHKTTAAPVIADMVMITIFMVLFPPPPAITLYTHIVRNLFVILQQTT